MTDPAESPKGLYRRAARGRDEATPAIVLSGVTLVVAAAVAILAGIALLVYFFA